MPVFNIKLIFKKYKYKFVVVYETGIIMAGLAQAPWGGSTFSSTHG